jgi:hypothetical protein
MQSLALSRPSSDRPVRQLPPAPLPRLSHDDRFRIVTTRVLAPHRLLRDPTDAASHFGCRFRPRLPRWLSGHSPTHARTPGESDDRHVDQGHIADSSVITSAPSAPASAAARPLYAEDNRSSPQQVGHQPHHISPLGGLARGTRRQCTLRFGEPFRRRRQRRML